MLHYCDHSVGHQGIMPDVGFAVIPAHKHTSQFGGLLFMTAILHHSRILRLREIEPVLVLLWLHWTVGFWF